MACLRSSSSRRPISWRALRVGLELEVRLGSYQGYTGHLIRNKDGVRVKPRVAGHCCASARGRARAASSLRPLIPACTVTAASLKSGWKSRSALELRSLLDLGWKIGISTCSNAHVGAGVLAGAYARTVAGMTAWSHTKNEAGLIGSTSTSLIFGPETALPPP